MRFPIADCLIGNEGNQILNSNLTFYFKVITMPVVGKEMRENMEAQFDVKNKELMSRLHPQTAEPQLPTNRSHRESRLGSRDNEGRIVPEIKLESEDSDSDVQVVSDDECQVIDAKIKPRKKRKPSSGFKDFQYEAPGLHNKMRKEDSEIINLASSDEEIEPVRNGSSDPLPLLVPINKVPKVQLPPAHLTQHITTSATLITEPCLPTRTTTPSSPQRIHQLSPPPSGNMELLIDLLEQMSRINSELFQLFLEPEDEHCYVPTAHHENWPRILTWSQMRTAYKHGYNYLYEVTKNEGYSKDYDFPHPSIFPSTRTSTAIKSSL